MEKTYDFDVLFTCRCDECDKSFKELAVENVLKLSRYNKHILDGNILLDKQNSAFNVEISLRIPGHTFRAKHADYNQVKALDASVEKVKIQLKRLKSKVVNHRVAVQFPEKVNPESEQAEETENSE